VHEVQVEVVNAEVLEGLVKSTLNLAGVVEGVPELRGDPEILTLNGYMIRTQRFRKYM
jgi:hypothetical protein